MTYWEPSVFSKHTHIKGLRRAYRAQAPVICTENFGIMLRIKSFLQQYEPVLYQHPLKRLQCLEQHAMLQTRPAELACAVTILCRLDAVHLVRHSIKCLTARV